MRYVITGGLEKDIHFTAIIESQEVEKNTAPTDPPPISYKEQKKEK